MRILPPLGEAAFRFGAKVWQILGRQRRASLHRDVVGYGCASWAARPNPADAQRVAVHTLEAWPRCVAEPQRAGLAQRSVGGPCHDRARLQLRGGETAKMNAARAAAGRLDND